MTLDYQSPSQSTTTNHDHVYSTLVGVFGFFMLLSILCLLFVKRQIPPAQTAGIMLCLGFEAAYFIAAVGVLAIRLLFPAQRRWPTLFMNIVLLPAFPLGTALGVYGLWKVDKRLR